MVFFGAWKAYQVVTILACWAALVIGGVYMIRAIRALLHGPLPERWAGVADAANAWRKLPFVLLLACLFLFGLYPSLLTDRLEPAAEAVVTLATGGTTTGGASEAVHTHPGHADVVGDPTFGGAQLTAE